MVIIVTSFSLTCQAIFSGYIEVAVNHLNFKPGAINALACPRHAYYGNLSIFATLHHQIINIIA